MKSGIRTTEFWVTILTIIASSATSLEGVLEPKWAAMFATISSLAYTIARAFTKGKVLSSSNVPVNQ